jgi:S1-C subfamily serine protease
MFSPTRESFAKEILFFYYCIYLINHNQNYMKIKSLKFVVYFFSILMISLTHYSYGTSYSELHVMTSAYTDGSFGTGTANYSLYINDRLILSFIHSEIVKVKIYSKGRISISLLAQTNSRFGGSIDINENKSYYYLGGGIPVKTSSGKTLNAEITQKDFEDLKVVYRISKTIEVEEDIQSPYGKLPIDLEASRPMQGSGFLINAKGHVLTNFHVVDGAKKITIKGINGDYNTSLQAKIIAIDRLTDLALLEIESKLVTFKSPPYQLANSLICKQGEAVFALGYPIKDIMGQEIKVTDGIINSTKGFKNSISEFQFSAAIQPGNSGGPLLNRKGQVVGIVTSKLAAKNIESAGYAIKSNYVTFFLSQSLQEDNTQVDIQLEGKELSELVQIISNFVYIIETE